MCNNVLYSETLSNFGKNPNGQFNERLWALGLTSAGVWVQPFTLISSSKACCICFQQSGEKLDMYWLVVSTPLKNISPLGLLFPISGKIKKVPNHQPVYHFANQAAKTFATKCGDNHLTTGDMRRLFQVLKVSSAKQTNNDGPQVC